MKTPRAVSLPLLLVVALVAGCETPRAARIREHAALFASLDPFSKKLVEDGLFDFGFSSEALYMSLGKPNRVTTAETEDGVVETWVYKNFLYGNARNITVAPRETAPRPIVSQRAMSQGLTPAIPVVPARPTSLTVADMSDPPLATLLIELRDGRVVAAHFEF